MRVSWCIAFRYTSLWCGRLPSWAAGSGAAVQRSAGSDNALADSQCTLTCSAACVGVGAPAATTCSAPPRQASLDAAGRQVNELGGVCPYSRSVIAVAIAFRAGRGGG